MVQGFDVWDPQPVIFTGWPSLSRLQVSKDFVLGSDLHFFPCRSPFFLLDTTSHVPKEDPAPSSSPGRYNWFYPNGWAYALTFEIVYDYVGVYSSTTLFFHLFQVQLIKASKGKCRVVSRPRVAPFWRHPRTGVSFFNRWWTREHFHKNSSDYYVLWKQLNTTQETFLKVLKDVPKELPFSCRELLDAAEYEAITLLDSYLEAKAETDKAKLDMEKALKELEETKFKLKEVEPGLGALNEKYENTVTKLRIEAYFNSIEQLKDSPNGPIPFAPHEEGVGGFQSFSEPRYYTRSEPKVDQIASSR
ncbi:hypothetical protein SESBI_05531 [Sesbania bispinosa]|nr:hypothetical protein SESBI_05531 [Sesbania bispinosa]